MQNLEKAIAKLDKEIEAKSNKILSLNENTKLTFLYIDNNIKKFQLVIMKIICSNLVTINPNIFVHRNHVYRQPKLILRIQII